jgi:hypothetical protein
VLDDDDAMLARVEVSKDGGAHRFALDPEARTRTESSFGSRSMRNFSPSTITRPLLIWSLKPSRVSVTNG